jgi:acetylornithine deacetylase/succinyl-diaminopimelate desuccinylase-like protein
VTHPLRALLLLGILALSACREAGGVAQDPMDVEAEEQFIKFLKIDTTNPPGNETPAAQFLLDALKKEQIDARLVGSDPKRQAVYARLSSGSSEKALLLLSHLDVVPAGQGGWTHPPFSGARDGGYIWGRGALDMKSTTIAHLYSLIDLKRRGAKLNRDVIFLAVPDEELGGMHGAKALLDKQPQLFDNVGFVLGEGGTNETAVDKVIFWGIEVQQKNPLWLRLTSEGRGGHSASPPDNGGATRKLVHALSAIEAVETPYKLDPSVARSAAAIAKVRTDGRAAIFRKLREPLDVKLVEKELPEGYRALLRDTVAITHIEAGSVVNIMPTRAYADLDIRLLPSHGPQPMIDAIRAAVGNDAKVEVLLSSEPVPDSPASGVLYDTIARAMREASPGSTVGPSVTAGTNDGRFFRARGVVAYGIAPFKVNYYDADSVHGTDERIRARFFADGVRLTRRIVRDFCAQ